MLECKLNVIRAAGILTGCKVINIVHEFVNM